MTSNYRHQLLDDTPLDLPVGKVVCVGRNYADHARELNNPVPDSPLLFIKPASSLVELGQTFDIPTDRGAVHYELEIALLIGDPGDERYPARGACRIAGIGLALDLTLRDLQQQLKDRGQPWEIAKSFAGACPLSRFQRANQANAVGHFDFKLFINNELRQTGDSRDMLFPLPRLLDDMQYHFGLQPGDVVLTGTPAGVGPLQRGDTLRCELGQLLQVTTEVRP